jgi:hypothetical protein
MSLNLQTTIVTTSPYTINSSDTLILVNRNLPSSIILPSLSSGEGNKGKSFYIKDYSGTSSNNPITITAANARLINGISFAMLNGNYSHIQIAYDGTNWMTIA